MITCPTCGEKLSDTATICNSCGMEIKQEDINKPSAVSIPTADTQPQKTVKEPPKAKAYLSLKRGAISTGDIFYIGIKVTIGRFDAETGPVDVDLGLLPEATYISRKHAIIQYDESGQWLLTDLGSNNGTFIWTEDKKIKRIQPGEAVKIKEGDEIAFGNAHFEFHEL